MKLKNEFILTTRDFNIISKLLHDSAGISLGETKNHLVYNRLASRLRINGLKTFSDYIVLLEDKNAPEWEFFINALTTNLTSFFREPYHFDLLAEYVEKNLLNNRGNEPIKIWCSACSTGEEAYSIAITMMKLFGTSTPPVKILATDLNTAVLSTARIGAYAPENVHKLEPSIQNEFFRSIKSETSFYIKPEVKALISFKKLNLLDKKWPMTKKFDVIFCRNVMIYFDKNTQRELLEKFSNILSPNSALFIGHSENIDAIQSDFKLNRQTMYQKVSG